MLTRLIVGISCLFSVVVTPAAQAQANWPARAVRIVVPYAPGAFTDVGARALAAELSEQFGQPVVVENRGGAGIWARSSFFPDPA